MDTFKKLLIALGLLGLAYGAGYYYSPQKIKEVEKIVEKQVIKIVHEKYDPTTGKLVERTETTDTKDTSTNKSKVETLKPKKLYALKGGAVINPRDIQGKIVPRVGAEVRLPFFDSWAGLEGDINIDRPSVGAYLRVEF